MSDPSRKGFYWLASYPKSGNTWFRIVLNHLLHKSSEPLDLNHLAPSALGVFRQRIDDALGFESAALTHDEIDELRPALYRWQSEQTGGVSYNKLHDAYTYLKNGQPMLPSENCLGAIYFIRNPLDVAISMANHMGSSIDTAIESMGKKDSLLAGTLSGQRDQLRQQILTWSLHVESWTKAKEIPVLVLRYEDMRREPLATFAKAIDFLGLDVSQEALEQALLNSRLEKLQEFEETFGFHEKPVRAGRFFRKGKVDEWREMLTAAQREKIVTDHHQMMERYGYSTKELPVPHSID